MPNLSEYPEFGESYIQYFDPYLQSFEIRRKGRANGNMSLAEVLELIDVFLYKYQMTYIPSKSDNRIILFPYMYIEPSKGEKIVNKSTKEIYIVDQVIKNPQTNKWEGLLKLDLVSPPSLELLHSLQYQADNDKIVRFRHEQPDEIPNLIGANLEKLLIQPPPIFPTITWTIKSVEPGSLGRFQDSRKEYKPRLRESVKDPFVQGHTVQINGQFFDNIVQFDSWSNDPRTSDRLIRWFEQFMRLNMENLRRYGLNQGIFYKRTEDDYNKTWRQAFSVRSTQYFFRTEQLEAIYTRDLMSINIEIGVESTDPVNKELNAPRWVAGQLVTGELTTDNYRALFYHSGQYQFGSIDIRQ